MHTALVRGGALRTIRGPTAIEAAVRRAARFVADEGRQALADVVCSHR